ncbi:L-histidine N(alpha)-methyltransferase [Lichenicoccus sp.]|uniref:L-histidine N(alpha)-methyltransferase n=1 Tax=Lichenicoccus sp. TaxID=2781899 RepID=UPI003D0B3586
MASSHFGLRDAPSSRSTVAPPSKDVQDILQGLTAAPKTLPARFFYDDAGCALFGRITKLPEYYVTRAETALLAEHAAVIVANTAPASVLVEYGASDENKAAMLLDAVPQQLAAYVPIDIAGPPLQALRERMRISHPHLTVQPLCADFTAPVALPPLPSGSSRLGFFPGSTIGNFDPPMVVSFLRRARADLSRGGTAAAQFIIGTDLRKDASELVPAYDDNAGVTAAFNRNILRHVNRLAAGRFDPELFAHRAIWNEQAGRIEMHLASRLPQVIQVAGRTIAFAAGETIHTESSYKHTRQGFLALAAQAGWRSDGFWTDSQGRFGMHRLIAD